VEGEEKGKPGRARGWMGWDGTRHKLSPPLFDTKLCL